MKLTRINEDFNHVYGNKYFPVICKGSASRIVIGPNTNHVELIERLIGSWNSKDYFVLYVLLMSHRDSKLGRYQSPILAMIDLDIFLSTYSDFLEHDGRHHLWVGDPLSNNLIVYDNHNIIYAYGDLHQYEEILMEQSYILAEFSIPSPHCHHYNPVNADKEKAILEHFDWTWFPLQGGDDP